MHMQWMTTGNHNDVKDSKRLSNPIHRNLFMTLAMTVCIVLGYKLHSQYCAMYNL